MAGDWIKFETSTSDKPEVFIMAASLEIDPDAVVGKLLRVWKWFDEHTEKGNAPSVSKMLLDRVTGVNKFCDAMIGANWMNEENGQISLPNFDRHNGQTAKTRCLTAKRVAKSKLNSNAKSNAPSVSDPLPKEEKRRSKDSPRKKFSEDDFLMAEFIYEKVLKVADKTKKPNLEKWADTVRLMREQDNLKHSEIKAVFLWANSDGFWATNILSPTKLREQFSQISAKSKPVLKSVPQGMQLAGDETW